MDRGAWWATVHGVTNHIHTIFSSQTFGFLPIERMSQWTWFASHWPLRILVTSLLKKKKKFFLATSCGIQGLNSPNEDQTRAPGIGSTESTTGRPGNSLVISLNGSWPHILSVKSQLVSFADASPGLFVVWVSLAGAWNGNSKGNIFKWNSFSPARRRGWKDPGNHRRLVCRGSAARVSMNPRQQRPQEVNEAGSWAQLSISPLSCWLPAAAADPRCPGPGVSRTFHGACQEPSARSVCCLFRWVQGSGLRWPPQSSGSRHDHCRSSLSL